MTHTISVSVFSGQAQFAEALRKNHVPFDLHVYQHGAHGMGLKDKPPFAHPHPWANDCLFWLKAQNFVN